MKSIIICILSFLLVSCSGDDNSYTNNSLLGNSHVLDAYLNEAKFEELFPHANGGYSKETVADPNLYSYDNMREGLDLKEEEFSAFLSEGDDTIKRLELAAILANWAQETTGGWSAAPGGYTKWGLYYQEEVQARFSTDHCYFDPTNKYQPTIKPVGGYCFFGRGPIQLSHNANYGAFSEFLFNNDMLVLLNDPDEIIKNGALAFASGFWFWTIYANSPNVPNKTCHQVMVEDGAQGFGKVINIVNGGIECNKTLPPFLDAYGEKIRNRADHFHYFATFLGVESELPQRPEGDRKDDQIWNDYYRAMLVGCIQ